MNHNYGLHLSGERSPTIECRQAHLENGQSYAVLQIGAATIFPSVAQLRKLRDVLSSYLFEEERQRVATPGSVPTLAESMRNPEAFVEGMECDEVTHQGLPF